MTSDTSRQTAQQRRDRAARLSLSTRLAAIEARRAEFSARLDRIDAAAAARDARVSSLLGR